MTEKRSAQKSISEFGADIDLEKINIVLMAAFIIIHLILMDPS